MKKLEKNSHLYLMIAFIVMALLFYSSSQTYTQQSLVSPLDHLLKHHPFEKQLQGICFQYDGNEVSIQAKGYIKFIEFFIRKGAHYGLYFILGGSWFLGLLPKIKSILLTGIISWLSATGYAGLDEFHQMITGDRTPSFQDVMLDSIGALTAVAIGCHRSMLFFFKGKQIKSRII